MLWKISVSYKFICVTQFCYSALTGQKSRAEQYTGMLVCPLDSVLMSGNAIAFLCRYIWRPSGADLQTEGRIGCFGPSQREGRIWSRVSKAFYCQSTMCIIIHYNPLYLWSDINPITCGLK